MSCEVWSALFCPRNLVCTLEAPGRNKSPLTGYRHPSQNTPHLEYGAKQIRPAPMAVETHEKTRPDCVFGGKGAVEFGCIYTLLVDKYFQHERELEPAKAKHCSNSTHISQYNRSRATLDATGRHYWYWTSICIVSPQQPPWSR